MRYREFIKKIYFDSIAKQRLFPTLQFFNEHYDDNFGDFNIIREIPILSSEPK